MSECKRTSRARAHTNEYSTFQVQTGAHRYYDCDFYSLPPVRCMRFFCSGYCSFFRFFCVVAVSVFLFSPQVPVRNAKRDALFSK